MPGLLPEPEPEPLPEPLPGLCEDPGGVRTTLGVANWMESTMHLVSQPLAWLKAVFCGPPESGRAPRSRTPEPGTQLSVSCPSPQMWGAILAGARRRRAPHLWPPAEPPALADDFHIGTLVRAYLLPEDERTRALASSAREAR